MRTNAAALFYWWKTFVVQDEYGLKLTVMLIQNTFEKKRIS